MKYQETDHSGSFTAQGTGFLYEYHARLKALLVSRAGSIQPLLQLDLEGPLSTGSFDFVRLFEKTTQVKALKFSNNVTANIAETLDDSRLPAILKRTARLALYAFDLKREKFEAFQDSFLADHELKRVEIKKADGHAGTDFYIASLETRRSNFVSVRSSTLHGATLYLSDKIMQDIIAREFGYHVDSWMHTLLSTASDLSTLAFVLNDRFDPSRKAGNKTPSLLFRLATIDKSLFHSNT